MKKRFGARDKSSIFLYIFLVAWQYVLFQCFKTFFLLSFTENFSFFLDKAVSLPSGLYVCVSRFESEDQGQFFLFLSLTLTEMPRKQCSSEVLLSSYLEHL